MEPFVTMGLVLKETQYREADRILTILTPKLGVISALAKNSMRVTNKLFSGCGLFCYSEFTLVKGRSMYVVQEADVENVFYDVSKSLEGVGVAMYLAEMTYTLFAHRAGGGKGASAFAQLPVHDQQGQSRPARGQGCF